MYMIFKDHDLRSLDKSKARTDENYINRGIKFLIMWTCNEQIMRSVPHMSASLVSFLEGPSHVQD